jgi:hypothetical protein
MFFKSQFHPTFQMSKTIQQQDQPRLSCLSTFFQDGIKRIQNAIGSEKFTFMVNGSRVESTVIESVFLSPAVEQLLLNDCETREFIICDENIDLKDFLIVIGFIRFGGVSESSQSFSSQKSLFSICEELQNHKLKLLGLISPDILIPSSNFDIMIDDFASKFHEQSKSDLLEMPIDLLNSVLLSPHLKITDEDWLLDLILLGCHDFLPLLCHVHIELLSVGGMKRLCEVIKYSDVTEDIWDGIVRRFTSSDDKKVRFNRWINPRGFDSIIISDFPSILDEFRHSRIKLLYRGTRDGFGSSDFHRTCDGHSDTITLIRTTKDFIFGGYTPLSWDSTTNDYKTDASNRSFVFTIKNPHSFGCRKFGLKPDHAQYAIYTHKDCGPIFGNGCTIKVYNNCSTTNNNSTRLYSYVNDTGLNEFTVFTGEQKFTVKEIEVFGVTKEIG